MNLDFRSIVAPGDLKNERLTLRALENLDVGDYLVAQTSYVDEGPTTTLFHTLWLPYKPVQKGDLVVIYTKLGTNKERTLSKGNKAHFFYMDLKTSIWDDSSKGALILHAPIWESKSVNELTRK